MGIRAVCVIILWCASCATISAQEVGLKPLPHPYPPSVMRNVVYAMLAHHHQLPLTQPLAFLPLPEIFEVNAEMMRGKKNTRAKTPEACILLHEFQPRIYLLEDRKGNTTGLVAHEYAHYIMARYLPQHIRFELIGEPEEKIANDIEQRFLEFEPFLKRALRIYDVSH